MIYFKDDFDQHYVEFIAKQIRIELLFDTIPHHYFKLDIDSEFSFQAYINWETKIEYRNISIMQLNKKSFLCQFEFDNYSREIRQYFNYKSSPFSIINELEYKIKYETIKTFYENNRTDIINFKMSFKEKNEN